MDQPQCVGVYPHSRINASRSFSSITLSAAVRPRREVHRELQLGSGQTGSCDRDPAHRLGGGLCPGVGEPQHLTEPGVVLEPCALGCQVGDEVRLGSGTQGGVCRSHPPVVGFQTGQVGDRALQARDPHAVQDDHLVVGHPGPMQPDSGLEVSVAVAPSGEVYKLQGRPTYWKAVQHRSRRVADRVVVAPDLHSGQGAEHVGFGGVALGGQRVAAAANALERALGDRGTDFLLRPALTFEGGDAANVGGVHGDHPSTVGAELDESGQPPVDNPHPTFAAAARRVYLLTGERQQVNPPGSVGILGQRASRCIVAQVFLSVNPNRS